MFPSKYQNKWILTYILGNASGSLPRGSFLLDESGHLPAEVMDSVLLVMSCKHAPPVLPMRKVTKGPSNYDFPKNVHVRQRANTKYYIL